MTKVKGDGYKELRDPVDNTSTTDEDFYVEKDPQPTEDIEKIAGGVPDAYSLYVLFMIVISYSSNQLNRYILTSVSEGMERSVGFGDGNGDSFEYSMLTGPITTFPYCTGVVVAGHLADKFNKVHLLVIMVIGWCLPHAAMAFAQEYWQLAVLRAVSIFMSAGYVSVGPAIIADYFPEQSRGLAIGIFGWAQPIGQGLVFGMGNGLVSSYNYRVALFVAGIWAVPLAIIILFTVKEKSHNLDLEDDFPEVTKPMLLNDEEQPSTPVNGESNGTSKAPAVVRTDSTAAFMKPKLNDNQPTAQAKPEKTHLSVMDVLRMIFSNKVLCCIYVAGSFKYISTLNWQFFRNQFFINFRGLTSAQVAYYMSWIPIIGGVGGGVVFGFISDRLVKRGLGPFARLLVVTGIHICAVPVILGVLLLPPYGCFAFVFFDEFLQRYFIAGINTAIIELVPFEYRVSAMSYAWMFFWIIGGNSTLLAPFIGDAFGGSVDGSRGSQYALLFLYWGGMIGAAFFLSLGTLIFYFTVFRKRNKLSVVDTTNPVPVVQAKEGEE